MKKLLITLSILLISAAGLFAQNFRTGYFLDGYMYKYQLNPAFQGERGFVALPGVGGISAGVESNILGSSIYLPSDAGTVSFMDSPMSTTDFMSRINQMSLLNESIDVNLLAIGFRAKNTYHTIDFSIKENASTNIPSDVFRFMKDPSAQNFSYNMSSWTASVDSYFQAAYGLSFKIKDVASIGFRAKFLLGIQSAYANMSDLRVEATNEKATVNATGTIIESDLINDLMVGEEINTDKILQSALDSPSYGAALDFGFSVDFLKHFTFSGSVLDLGFISWKNPVKYNYGPASWELNYSDYTDPGMDPETAENQLNAKLDELVAIFDFENPQHLDKHVQKFGFTTLLGLEFRIPFYNRISIAALGTHRFQGAHSWTEGRFSLNYAPFRWLSLSGSYAISTFGESYGAALNFHPKGLNIFAGVDSFKPILNMTPDNYPQNELNTNVKVGITFPFGKYNGRYPKKEKVENE